MAFHESINFNENFEFHKKRLALKVVMKEFETATEAATPADAGKIGCSACDYLSIQLLQRQTIAASAFKSQLYFHRLSSGGAFMIDRAISHLFLHASQNRKQLFARELNFLKKIENKPSTIKELTHKQRQRFDKMQMVFVKDLRISKEAKDRAILIPRHLVVTDSKSTPARLTLAANIQLNMIATSACTQPQDTGRPKKNDSTASTPSTFLHNPPTQKQGFL